MLELAILAEVEPFLENYYFKQPVGNYWFTLQNREGNGKREYFLFFPRKLIGLVRLFLVRTRGDPAEPRVSLSVGSRIARARITRLLR